MTYNLKKAKPHKRSTVNNYRNVIKELRDIARDHIIQRLNEIENKEHVPNDILSIILSNASIGAKVKFFQIVNKLKVHFNRLIRRENGH